MVLTGTTAALALFGGMAVYSFLNVPADTMERPVQMKLSVNNFRAGKITLQFQLSDAQTNRVVTDKDLTVESEQILHVFIFDSALDGFMHLHPKFDGTDWTANADISTNGRYWIWAQGRFASDNTDFTSSSHFIIEDGNPENIPTELNESRTGSASGSIVSMSSEPFHSNKLAMPVLTFSRTDGTAPELSDYLGAKAHVVVVPSAGDSLVHVHPMNARTNQLIIHTMFPSPGTYRIWVQFIDGGVLKVVPLTVKVDD